MIEQVIVSEKAGTSSLNKNVQSKQWFGVCEGRFFERLAGEMGAAQKVVLEQTPSALAGAAVLHNVIIVHPRFLLCARCFFMNYNATLCNTALGKFLLPFPGFSIAVQNFIGHTKSFGELAKEWQLKCKTPFLN